MMKLRKALAVCTTLVLAVCALSIAAAAQAPAFTIGNPYAGINWNTVGQYKTQLHVHSAASDGALTIAELVELHYALGYDILAITDHATVGTRWDRAPRIVPYNRALQSLGLMDRNAPRNVLTTQRRQEILDGVGRGGRGMMEVTGAIELMGVAESHIGAFWAGGYGQGLIGLNHDYRHYISEVQRHGGISIINHPGRITGASRMSTAQAEELYAIDGWWVNRYARLFRDFDSLIGFEINAKWDNETNNDRILWDNLLQVLIPHGVIPWGISASDGHRYHEMDRGWTVHLLPEKNEAALRHSMENGTFFGVNRYARPELAASGRESFDPDGAIPHVSRINVNQSAGTIIITAQNANEIVWVSNGNIIHRGATMNLHTHNQNVGVYVRAYIMGPGGILYVQPFTVLRRGQSWAQLQQHIGRADHFVDSVRPVLNAVDFFIAPDVDLEWTEHLTGFEQSVIRGVRAVSVTLTTPIRWIGNIVTWNDLTYVRNRE